ncbi:polysaccharide biosynthesis tyrosine autokinase [Cryobacterium roopkundense]|uniref:non-specific protein-tyrosine kinase n=1 Tax=Cryobacterium roopkundense TaxID=1001240 RepID=A0A7W8ZZI8_9MICO|nr:polysaccharide biosynthesis tyrosine autokinase [Cryobacterium roopkundense]MBB5642795.1 capsular exopolysaccharide synthesis family protein [Cryobacterium roopkundense]
MNLQQHLATIRLYWYIVVPITLLGGVLGWGLSQAATPSYTSTASLYFSLNLSGSATDLNQGSAYTQNQILSFAQLTKSSLVLAPVIDQLGLEGTAKALANSVNVSTPQNTVVLDVAVDNDDPERAALISNAVAASLSKNVEQIAPKTVDGTPSVSVRVIEPATVPTEPSSPNVRINVLAGFLLGLFLSILIIVLRQVLDTRVHSVAILTALTDLPLLGSIEQSKKKMDPLVMLRDPRSRTAELYRQMRANLAFVAVDSTSLSIVVTSSIAGEGKSTITSNLAQALSEGGQRVLLIDADLRRPAIANYAGLEGQVGLTTVLVGRADYRDVIQPWGTSGLRVLPSGRIPPNPSELLSSRAMSDLVALLKDEYDVILIDAPPMSGAADAAILSRLVDGALVVADRTQVHRPQLLQTLDSLSKSGVHILGIVLNRLAPNNDRQAYYQLPEGKATTSGSGGDRRGSAVRRTPTALPDGTATKPTSA